MTRRLSSILQLAVLSLTACGGGSSRWRPSLVSEVPDSTPVRFRAPSRGRVDGRALDWQRGQPRVLTVRGDTELLPQDATVDVRLAKKTNRAVAGGIIGAIAGVGLTYATCSAPNRETCGEQNVGPLLTAGLGALIGSAIKKDHWVRVRRDSP